MRKFKTIIALMLAVMMLSGIATLSAYAIVPVSDNADPSAAAGADLVKEARTVGEGMMTVSLRIEGVEKCMYYNKEIVLEDGATVSALIDVVNEMDDAPKITLTESSFGIYVSKIDEYEEFAYGGLSGWLFIINGISGLEGISEAALSDGDSVVFYYGDPYGGPGFQLPVEDISRLSSDGVISFTSEDTDFDDDWNPVVSVNPIVGATVTLDGVKYTTDDNGEITIEDVGSLSDRASLQIEKYDEEVGVPTVLRYAPDYTILITSEGSPDDADETDTSTDTEFADVDAEAWYAEAIAYCVSEGYFKGVDADAKLFAPLELMTMAQLYTALARIAGVDVDTAADPWYAPACEWAVENELTTEELFVPQSNVSREMFIYMFYMTAGIIGDYDMSLSADISDATDFDKIFPEYLDAISWAVASGIISGTSAEELTLEPGLIVNRATVCQMLYNYYC